MLYFKLDPWTWCVFRQQIIILLIFHIYSSLTNHRRILGKHRSALYTWSETFQWILKPLINRVLCSWLWVAFWCTTHPFQPDFYFNLTNKIQSTCHNWLRLQNFNFFPFHFHFQFIKKTCITWLMMTNQKNYRVHENTIINKMCK